MSICLANLASIATIVLAVFAVVATIYAARNLWVIEKKYRYDILVSLTDQINTDKERRSRAVIHNAWKSRNWNSEKIEDVGNIILNLFDAIWENEQNNVASNEKDVELKEAIEGTVASLDKIGYFLMERDRTIQNETPIQIWSIAEDMWNKLGTFVEKRHGERGEVWATYFKKIGQEAKPRMAQWRRGNN